ncbi:MAG: hypothetical protein M3Q44_06320 [bacterium]|nr:hypothetical protein [bacterium]
MQSILKHFIKLIPVMTAVLLLIIIQLLFIGINIVGIILFTRLFIFRKMYRTISAAALVSLIYDSVKMNPLGAWSSTFFIVALPVLILFHLLKIQSEKELNSWPSTFLVVFLVVVSASLQSFLLMRISGQNIFDFNSLYSIVALSTLYILFQKFTHINERRFLLD